ncbi:AsnC family transcriptional regulator [Microbispora triticiradicis]|uniref:AsnC family transcriptional regulator n=3 Tax=Microbispora TaxID=2005 RepID=A0ABY3LVI5_9ACTN|nr:AsnC family transcriptional regulator [Microbispora triticiradicis]TLP57974.1 AsnC family transcriptional regulator [Microbispora fusca]TYB56277.1 AsnC family transcriptional regulator [Microbispora tritici]
MAKIGVLDSIDRALVHALQIDGRVPFRRVAEVIGTSEHTIGRRYRRLRSQGLLRVVGMLDGTRFGQVSWAVRLVCTPDAAGPVAEALARREDTVWVRLLSGGTEIACGVQAGEEGDDLLLRRLPRTPRIASMSAHATLHMFAGWRSRTAALSEEQAARLRPDPLDDEHEITLSGEDHALLRVLARDGRAGLGELAAAAGCSQTTARRRLEQLRAAGALRLDVEIPAQVLGYHAEAWLWMKVEPRALTAVGAAMAGHAEADVVAATTGPANLMAGVTCRDTRALYRYLTERVASLSGVLEVETAPVIRTIKRAGALLPATPLPGVALSS